MIRKFRLAAVGLTLGALAGCASADRPRAVAATTGDNQCFSARLANNFRAVGNEAVDVEISRSRVYRLTLGAGCFDVNWASSIALRSRSGSGFICSASDAELIVPSAGGPDRCLVTGIRRLTEADIAAARGRN